MKNKIRDCCLVVAGLILIAAGLFMIKILSEPQGVLQALPYICIGIGCGVFGQGTGNIISLINQKKNPHIYQQIEIEKNDERNMTITNRAKAKSYDLMVFLFGALLLSFALMGVDMITLLLLVFAYLTVVFYGVYYRCKYEKEM